MGRSGLARQRTTRRAGPIASTRRDHQRPGNNPSPANGKPPGQRFAQDRHAERDGEHHRKLVDRRNQGRRRVLERPVMA
jgi:hypothetical protein